MKGNKINAYFVFWFLCLTTFFLSCDKDDDPAAIYPQPVNCIQKDAAYQFKYKDQDLQGSISGETWKYAMANVKTTTWSTDYTHEFEIIGFTEADSCFSTIFTNNTRILLHVTDTIQVLTPGKHNLLDGDYVNRTGSLITMVYADTDTSIINIVTGNGGYEILTVDTASKLITARIDICYDEETFINGYFKAKYCYY